MRLPELQNDDKEVKKLRSKELPEGWKGIEEVKEIIKGKKYISLGPELEGFFRDKNS